MINMFTVAAGAVSYDRKIARVLAVCDDTIVEQHADGVVVCMRSSSEIGTSHEQQYNSTANAVDLLARRTWHVALGRIGFRRTRSDCSSGTCAQACMLAARFSIPHSRCHCELSAAAAIT